MTYSSEAAALRANQRCVYELLARGGVVHGGACGAWFRRYSCDSRSF